MSDVIISKRMMKVAEYAKGETIADIGCDHAYVSIYLIQHNMSEHVIAMDVREGPLEIAKRNIAQYGLENRIETRLSDGFKALRPGEAGCAVIAGMGGILIKKLLIDGKIHTDDGIDLVLQPQSDVDVVRRYIILIGYYIEDESFIIEDNKPYNIIRAKKNKSGVTEIYSEEEYLYGKKLIEKKCSALNNHLQNQRIKMIYLIHKLENEESDKVQERLLELRNEMTYIDNVLKCLNSD